MIVLCQKCGKGQAVYHSAKNWQCPNCRTIQPKNPIRLIWWVIRGMPKMEGLR
jgi:lipopolysaccharide biosynthesis regulator YciM